MDTKEVNFKFKQGESNNSQELHKFTNSHKKAEQYEDQTTPKFLMANQEFAKRLNTSHAH
jgi:hypothetical protein